MTGELVYLTASEIPPLAPGESRLVFATRAEILNDFLDFPKWDAIYQQNGTVIRLSQKGEYVIDIVPIGSTEENSAVTTARQGEE